MIVFMARDMDRSGDIRTKEFVAVLEENRRHR